MSNKGHKKNSEYKKGPHIVLIGFMGSGKTSIGRCLSYKLKRAFYDTDKMIEEHYLALPYDEQGKDILPFETMLKLIKKFEGLRIYKIEDDDDEE